MFFILQKEDKYNDLDLDLLTLKMELDKQKFQQEYTYMSIKDFDSKNRFPQKIKIQDAIPVGSIDFVQNYLKLIHNIETMTPIEVPNEMRFDKFLNRKYSIINKNELLTKSGYYFTKYASKLKEFSYIGLVEQLKEEQIDINEPFLKDGLYVFSEIKNILSEYRVFVFHDKIKGIQFYDGDPTIMPTPDEIKKIQEMVLRYMLNNKRPQAYSLDIGLIEKNDELKRDVMVIECHPFCSLGLYGLTGSFLPYAYREGLDWYIKYNTPLKEFNNFD